MAGSRAEPADSEAVARVRAALLAAGHPDTIQRFPDGTRTAAEAAAAIGCQVAQIAKSIVFRASTSAGECAAVVIASGAGRVDAALAGKALGVALARADAAFVRAETGFAIGGVAPVGHLHPPLLLLDQALLDLHPIWAAAGTPFHVFRTSAAELARMTGARAVAVTEGSPVAR